MKKKIIQSEKVPAPIGPYSQAIRSGELLFASGQIAIDPVSGKLITHNISDETHQVMKNIKHLLESEGLDTSSILKTSIFLSDMNLFSQVNKIYGSYFEGDFPARETIEVAGLPKNVNVEISVIAHY